MASWFDVPGDDPIEIGAGAATMQRRGWRRLIDTDRRSLTARWLFAPSGLAVRGTAEGTNDHLVHWRVSEEELKLLAGSNQQVESEA